MVLTRDRARAKLIKLLPRRSIEELSGLESPWRSVRSDLEKIAISKWGEYTEEVILEAVEGLIIKAREP